jgi:hypothetical protein
VKSAFRTLTAILVSAVIAASITFYSFRPSEAQQALGSIPAREFPELTVIDDTRAVLTFGEQKALFRFLANHLSDPAAAQVRRLRRSTAFTTGFCGEINAKNNLGAYIGFTPFTGGFIGKRATLLIFDHDIYAQTPGEINAQLTQFGCLAAVGVP